MFPVCKEHKEMRESFIIPVDPCNWIEISEMWNKFLGQVLNNIPIPIPSHLVLYLTFL
jgi:hypothetical protein